MNETPKALRKAYRAKARVDLCRLDFWLFTALLYVFTFVAVSLLTFVGGFVAGLLFRNQTGAAPEPLALGFQWANLILSIFLIAIGVLYIWGGPAGIPFFSPKKKGTD